MYFGLLYYTRTLRDNYTDVRELLDQDANTVMINK